MSNLLCLWRHRKNDSERHLCLDGSRGKRDDLRDKQDDAAKVIWLYTEPDEAVKLGLNVAVRGKPQNRRAPAQHALCVTACAGIPGRICHACALSQRVSFIQRS